MAYPPCKVHSTIFYIALIISLAGHMAYGQDTQTDDILLSESPHIFIEHGDFKLIWVEDGVRREEVDTQSGDSAATRLLGFSPYSHYRYTQSEQYSASYAFSDIDRFVAISDIHGNYPNYRHFLRVHGVIDDQDNWVYGDGHLIVLGDILDRGAGVTEALWLTFKLEEQALRAGGRVHFIAGNHESMILYADLRYVHERYERAADLMHVPFKAWFGHSSILGRWLRRRPVMITINNTLFVHAGISSAFLQQDYTIDEVNHSFREKLFTLDSLVSIPDKRLDLLRFSEGPLWYRGYFKDTPDPVPTIDSALQMFGVDRMIIGHTPGDSVRTLHGNRVIAIDSYIQRGEQGEILLYDKGVFYRGFRDGTVVELDTASSSSLRSTVQDHPRLGVFTK